MPPKFKNKVEYRLNATISIDWRKKKSKKFETKVGKIVWTKVGPATDRNRLRFVTGYGCPCPGCPCPGTARVPVPGSPCPGSARARAMPSSCPGTGNARVLTVVPRHCPVTVPMPSLGTAHAQLLPGHCPDGHNR